MKSSGSNSSGGSAGTGGEITTTKIERKTIEKQRRMQMKSLSLHLASLIPKRKPSSSSSHVCSDCAMTTTTTQLDNLEEAASYILSLRNRIQELKDRKDAAAAATAASRSSKLARSTSDVKGSLKFKLPLVEVRYQNLNLEVVLIVKTTTSHGLTFHKLIRIIEDEGVDVVNASHSTLADKVVYTIHSQVRNPRSGLEASRISNSLKDWIYMQNV